MRSSSTTKDTQGSVNIVLVRLWDSNNFGQETQAAFSRFIAGVVKLHESRRDMGSAFASNEYVPVDSVGTC